MFYKPSGFFNFVTNIYVPMKDFRIELRWGIIFSLLTMILGFVEKMFLGWHDQYIEQQLGYHFIVLLILFFIVFYFGIREKRETYYKGKMTWKQGVVSGGMIAVIVAILSPLSVFFIYHYISPEYFTNMIEYQTGKEKFPMKQSQAEDFFSMGSYIILEVSTALSFGIGASSISALLLRRKDKKQN